MPCLLFRDRQSFVSVLIHFYARARVCVYTVECCGVLGVARALSLPVGGALARAPACISRACSEFTESAGHELRRRRKFRPKSPNFSVSGDVYREVSSITKVRTKATFF